MITAKFDTQEFKKTMWNAMNYSEGFFQGVESNRLAFNIKLGEITVQLLNKYIDSRAKMYPESLHHVYEWGEVGSPSGRLFDIESTASTTSITFTGSFLPSRSVSDNSDTPFVNKATVMENQITIVIEPRNVDVLSFEANGEQVFTANTIYIDNPGGDAVSGSFGRTVEEFFDTYLTVAVLGKEGVLDSLRRPKEFGQYFASGAKGGGSAKGRSAGSKYMSITGVDIT